MAQIEITTPGGGGTPINTGVLQLENGVALDTTLRYVTDQTNTKSQLLLATNATTVEGTLKVKTNNVEYLDVEDGSGNNRFTISRPSLGQKVALDFASNPVGSTTIVGSIRTYTDGTNLNDIVQFREDGQTTFVERVNVEADSLVTTQTSSVIASTTTNANLVIAPNGTGALVASIPDGTLTGGNARGTNAVDLQFKRNINNQVASGNFSTISGGQNNTSSGSDSTVVGGQANTSSGIFSISGGSGCTASGSYSTAIGGNGNIASTGFATAIGGNGNTTAGFQSTTVGGGSNTISGQSSTIAGGGSNTISGQSSGVGAGDSNTISSNFSFGIGLRTSGYLYGQFQSASGFFAAIGDAQQSLLTARRQATLTTGATTVLSLDGTGTTNLIIPNSNNRMWNVQVRWVAVVTAITGTATGVTVGDTKTSTDLLAVARRAGTTTVSAHTSAGTHAIETVAGSLTAANIAYSAGASQEMAITFTGPTFAGGGSVTMRVVAAISLTEVAY